MNGYSLYEMFFIFLFWGIVGWMIEVVDMRIEAGEFQNRGFLHMPLCPLYGIGMLVMCMLFKEKREAYTVLFFSGIVVATLVEYFVGWLLETLFHTKWWDYSHMRFQIKGRVCLRNSILFGFGAILTIGFIQPVFETVIHRIPSQAGSLAIALIAAALVIDIAASTLRALRYKRESGDGNVFVIFKSHR